jgi:DNA-binding response OmpR family regulator
MVDKAILLIDTDLGFLFWLGQALDRAGYEAFPARGIPQAVALLAEFHLTVGSVILNYSLPGAEKFIVGLRQSQNYLKVISLVESRQPLAPGVDGICCKPSEINERSRWELVQIVQKVVESGSAAMRFDSLHT